VLLGLGLGYVALQAGVFEPGSAPPQIAEVPAPGPKATPQNAPAPTPDESERVPSQPAGLQMASLAPRPKAAPRAADAVKVFAAKSSEFAVRDESREVRLELSRGPVLVEFIPTGDTTLEVVGPTYRAKVVGTVFYAEAREDRDMFGVVTGAVEVRPTGSDEVIRVEAGKRWVSGEGLVQAEESELRGARHLVDIVEHEQALERIREEARLAVPAPAATPITKSKKSRPAKRAVRPEKDALEQLRRMAVDATRQRQYQRAAKLYERILAAPGPEDARRSAVRLDLARIYLEHLRAPDHAARHLRRFIQLNPRDIAAPSAKRRLCEIADERGVEEPLCAGR
jgi:hypothetical protein